ncbi:hypothetical protein HQ487_05275 [Candidatus Uhrbacteria bacterium]|nr:hypothetical protein [Candidatus Uhrbacteria bacterium]
MPGNRRDRPIKEIGVVSVRWGATLQGVHDFGTFGVYEGLPRDYTVPMPGGVTLKFEVVDGGKEEVVVKAYFDNEGPSASAELGPDKYLRYGHATIIWLPHGFAGSRFS